MTGSVLNFTDSSSCTWSMSTMCVVSMCVFQAEVHAPVTLCAMHILSVPSAIMYSKLTVPAVLCTLCYQCNHVCVLHGTIPTSSIAPCDYPGLTMDATMTGTTLQCCFMCDIFIITSGVFIINWYILVTSFGLV